MVEPEPGRVAWLTPQDLALMGVGMLQATDTAEDNPLPAAEPGAPLAAPPAAPYPTAPHPGRRPSRLHDVHTEPGAVAGLPPAGPAAPMVFASQGSVRATVSPRPDTFFYLPEHAAAKATHYMRG